MAQVKQIQIPITERDKYLDGTALTCVLTDSLGKKHVVWPGALEVPQELLINVSRHGHIESIECRYSKDLGRSTMHHLGAQRFFYRVHDRGVLARFGFTSPIMMESSAYLRFLDLIERMLDCTRVQTEDYALKWQLIFSVQLVYDEWKQRRSDLQDLLSQPPMR